MAHVALGAAVRPPPREVEHLPRQARTGAEILLTLPLRLRGACTLAREQPRPSSTTRQAAGLDRACTCRKRMPRRRMRADVQPLPDDEA